MKRPEMTKKDDRGISKWWLLLPALVLCSWLAWGWVMRLLYAEEQSRGLFGDSYGALNTLFSGFAFAGVIVTIFLQSRELKLQREDLKLTREELKRSAEAQEKLVESSRIAAEINALNTLIKAKEHDITNVHPTQRDLVKGHIRKRELLIYRLESTLEIVESPDATKSTTKTENEE